jgi:hypothetical protein
MQSEVQGINFDAGALGCEMPNCLGVTFISRLSSVYFFDERARQKTGRFDTTKSGTDEIRRGVTRLGKLREPITATKWPARSLAFVPPCFIQLSFNVHNVASP